MKSISIKDKYPVQTLDIPKDQTSFNNVDEIIEYLTSHINEHPVATYIATFDHFEHTKGLTEHSINPDISDVKVVVFCFGKELPSAQVAAIRPRSIAVVEENDKFIVSFMDAPNPQAHESMIAWTEGILR